MLEEMARALARSTASETIEYVMRNVRWLVPIVQTIHILSVAAVMSSVVFINLRVLGLAVRSQNLSEMVHRLMPWTFWALPTLFLSGGMFLLALPVRYVDNPVLGIKFAMLVPAIVLALVFYRLNRREDGYWERSSARKRAAKILAAVSLLLWTTIVLAGRWVGYSSYLFGES